MNTNKKNIPASIRDRLLNKSKELKRPFLEILQYYAMERFLYRLSISDFSKNFYLKGALLFKIWNPEMHRATMDIDMLAKTLNKRENLEKICKKICNIQSIPDDGIQFDVKSIKSSEIQIEAEYGGIRLEFEAELNKAIISMQVDIGFGDIITPKPQSIIFPTILNLPPPHLQGYTPESVIAEKLEVMVKRELTNSRMKDFYDIWILSKSSFVQKDKLIQAIQKTFQHRGTIIPIHPFCLTTDFSNHPEKQNQWNAWIKKMTISSTISLPDIISELKTYLLPIFQEIKEKTNSKDE